MPDETILENMGAIWSYDQFPFILAAGVTKMRADGMVYAPSYQGWFDPIRVIPEDTAKDMRLQIERIRSRKRQDERRLNIEYAELFNEITDKLIGISVIDIKKKYRK